jgi:CRP-like cAMP-binding protein
MTDASDKIKRHFSTYPLRHYANGQIILFANENPTSLFYLESGKVRKYDVSPKGNELVVLVFKSGAFFPMSWAIAQIPNRFFYRAETDTSLRIIPAEKALEFITSNPDVMQDLLKRMYVNVEGLLERMVYLMSATAARRLMYELAIECRHFGAKQADGSYLVPIREVDLAGRSGLSRETVSREFHKLKENGFVRLEKDGVRVLSLSRLEAEIGILP